MYKSPGLAFLKLNMYVFRGRSCKLDNITVVFISTELQSVQGAVHLGHHVSTINKGSLSTDGNILERV